MKKDEFSAKRFLDQKQEEHFKKFGVFADTNSKISEWMEEYLELSNIDLMININSLIDEWFDKQIKFQELAGEKENIIHATKLNSKAQTYRDCWKELSELINNSDNEIK